MSPAYADGLGIEDRIIGFFDWVFGFGMANNGMNGGTSDDITQRNEAINATKEFAITGTEWFFEGKDVVVKWIVSESPVPLDIGLISLIAVAIMLVLVLFMLKEHVKHALIIISIIGLLIIGFIMFNINIQI